MSRIIEIRFTDSKEMCAATQRFSHYYEIPGFVGKILSWEEMDGYYLQKRGSKTWWQEMYAGANLPDSVFEAFIKANLSDITPQERKILDLVADIEGPYYIIMTSYNALYVRDHEIAHAMWYLDSEYKCKAEKFIMDNWEDLRPVREHIKIHYEDNVIVDELHAYVGVYTRYLNGMFIPYPINVHLQLLSLFEEYSKKHIPKFYHFEKL